MNNRFELRERIIEILDLSGLEIFGCRKYFLINLDGEIVDFKDRDTNETLVSDKNFKLSIVCGVALLETSYSNQSISNEWINKLNHFMKVRDLINSELDKLK